MFARWLAKKRIQAECTHEWWIVNRYYVPSQYKADIYCGVCDKFRRKVSLDKAVSLVEVQKIRKEYEEGGR